MELQAHGLLEPHELALGLGELGHAGEWFFAPEWLDELRATTRTRLAERAEASPLDPGLPLAQLLPAEAWASAVAFFAIALALTRMVSVSSLSSVVGALLGYLLFCATGWLHFNWWTLAFIVIAGTVVFIRHRSNIERIVRGVEPRVGTS
jgi:hypothetical protein